MSDTFFTASPHWGMWIVLYFFIGGIAGAGFFLVSLLHLFGRPEDRPLVRQGYYLAFAGALVSGFLLTVDLGRPERFWHMVIQSQTGRLMFKAWVPMSVGVWGLLLFSLFTFLAVLPVRLLRRPGPSAAVAILGSVFGLFIAGYTGVLLASTNRPIWADSTLLGLLFLVSAASTGSATLILLAIWRRSGYPASLDWLVGFDRRVLMLELLVLVLFVVSLGSVARVLLGWWGLVLLVGVIGIGIVAPLVLERRAGLHRARLLQSAALVLLGGLLLRIVVLLSSSGMHVLGTRVTGP